MFIYSYLCKRVLKNDKKILVVDDDLYIIKVIKSRLEASNYEVVTASDGEECLNKFRSEKPDLIILDIMMPKMDGYTALVTMREETIHEDIPMPHVIVLSARGDSRLREFIE